MRIIVAPDSFKGSLTAIEVSDTIEQGIREIFPEAEIVKFLWLMEEKGQLLTRRRWT